MPTGGDDRKVEAAAVRLLARREHSTQELRCKLVAKGHEAESVDAVLEKLGAKRLVSDDRYLSSFVHHHAKRGQGPIRIRAELRRRGIADARVEQELDRPGEGEDAIDWVRLAVQVRQRKFGASRPRTPAERAKQARFLQYRGFDADQIRAALNSAQDTGSGQEIDLDPDGVDMDADAPDPGSESI